jgi:hypothetical protein
MRTVAFYFEAQSAAMTAHAELRAVDRLMSREVELAPLAVDGQVGTVLATSIADSDLSRVVEIASRLGGRLVADVPEAWTHPRPPVAIAGVIAAVSRRSASPS